MSGVYTLAPTGERIYEGQSAFGSTPDFDDPDFEVKQPGHSTNKKEGEPPTIFDMLLQRQKEIIRPLESYSLFVGPKGGGKSSLLALLQPAGTVRDTPKPTVALEYVFARRSKNTSTLKDVAHIWELGGGMKGDGVAELVGVPITTARLPTAVLAIVLDLSKPQNVIPACLHWLAMLRNHVQGRLDDLRTSGSSDAASEMEEKARESFQALWRKKHKKEDHPDRRNVDACAVPLMIVANKWDSIKDENNPLARDRLGLKALCQVLRFLAHQHGASLVFTSSKDKTLNKQFRSLLSFTLFHKLDKAMRTEKSPDKAIYVPRGADTFDELLSAGPVALDGMNRRGRVNDRDVQETLTKALAEFFGEADADAAPKPMEEDPDALETEQARLKEEADEFAEPVVDEAYKIKMDALEKYRQQQLRQEKENALAEKRREKRRREEAKAKAERLAKLEAEQAERRAARKAKREAEQAEALKKAQEEALKGPPKEAEAKSEPPSSREAKRGAKEAKRGAKQSKPSS